MIAAMAGLTIWNAACITRAARRTRARSVLLPPRGQPGYPLTSCPISGSGEVPVAIGPWDPHAAAIGRMRASDADRDRVIGALGAAYEQGLLTADELAARTSQALAARTYADLTAASAVLAERPAAPSIHPPARNRLSKKAVAYGTSAIVLAPALVAAFLTFYGGFIILFLVAFAGVVVSAAPMAPRRPGALPSAGRR